MIPGIILIVLILVFLMVLFSFVPVGLWISALAANVHVGLFNLVGMRLRRVPPNKIVLPLIKANKAGMKMDTSQLEAHYLAGGRRANRGGTRRNRAKLFSCGGD